MATTDATSPADADSVSSVPNVTGEAGAQPTPASDAHGTSQADSPGGLGSRPAPEPTAWPPRAQGAPGLQAGPKPLSPPYSTGTVEEQEL